MENVFYSNIQLLDIALNYLHQISEKEDPFIPQSELKSNMQGAFVRDINNVCHKLFKDGYILCFPGDPFYHDHSDVKLSFDGKTFQEAGGYSEQERIRKIKLNQIEIESRLRKRNEMITMIAAILAGIGAIGYLILEIFR